MIQRFDVIIVGSGIAGLSSALSLAQTGKKVLLATKKHLVAAATNFAQGGIAGVLSSIDSVEKHVTDTMIAGADHNKKSAVRTMAIRSSDAVNWLLDLGVPFATKDGELALTREGGHSVRRIAFVGDYTGKAIEQKLVSACKKNPNITIWTDAFVADLLIEKGKCSGVEIICKNAKTSSIVVSDAVIIATGGAGQLYSHTTNPAISTGDGIALAQRAGAKLTDMEFIQFHPTAFLFSGKTQFLLSEALRGEGAYIVNSRGERFMKRYDKRLELAPRDIVARAIYEESKKGPVYLDLRHLHAQEVRARFPTLTRDLKKFKLDLATDLIPIGPAAHYLCGGIAVNLKGETGVSGLFAFGEASYTGVHGANRLASNSLLEAVVFAKTVSETLGRGRKMTSDNKQMISKIQRINFKPHKVDSLTTSEKQMIGKLRRQLKKTMWENVGVVRTHEGLMSAQKTVTALQRELTTKMSHHSFAPVVIETHNLFTVALAVITAALKRKKSLGCHSIMPQR